MTERKGGGVVVVCPRLSLLRDVDGEYGVRAGGLVVHVGGGGGAVEGAVLEALHRLVRGHHGAGRNADLEKLKRRKLGWELIFHENQEHKAIRTQKKEEKCKPSLPLHAHLLRERESVQIFFLFAQ